YSTMTSGQVSRAFCLTTRGAVYCSNSTMNPTPLDAGGLTFAQLDGGVDYTCGVTSTGAAYCQGLNDAGQLGDGTYGGRPGFAAVVGGVTFATLRARGGTNCGL